MINLYNICLSTFLFIALFVFKLSHADTIPNDSYLYYHPVTITASELPEAQNQPLEQLSLMVAKQGQLHAIPFQFEEYDELGMIYLNGAAKEPIVGNADKLDGNDLLVFMYRDSSTERASKTLKPKQGSIIKELLFKQHDGQYRYAYLVKNNPLRSSKRYVSYKQDTGEIQGENYYFKFKPNNLAQAEAYRVSNATHNNPAKANNLFKDSLFELKTSVLVKLMRFKFTNKRNIRIKPVAALHGPVRVPVVLKVQSTFFGLPVFTMYSQFNVYDHAINAPGIEINKPRMRTLIKNFRRAARYLLEPEVVFSVDYQNFNQTNIQIERTNRQHKGIGIIDGEYNAYENAIKDTFLPGQWLWFNNPSQDWRILTTSAVPEEFLDIKGLNPHVIYEDKKNEARVGFSLRGEKVALKELAKGFKLADKLFKDMKPYNLDGIFLAVIDGVDEGKPFKQIMHEQNLSPDIIQELFNTFQLALDIETIGNIVDMGGSYKGRITLGEFLNKAGVNTTSAQNFMGMFQMSFNPNQEIDDLPQYTHDLMQQLYLGYRDKIKNGITVWTPLNHQSGNSNFSPSAFNQLLNNPPRLVQ